MPFNTQADFIAVLTYRTTEQGGRNLPAQSGYRPQLKFGFNKMQTSGEQKFIGKSRAYPGDTVEAEIRILAIPFFTNKLTVGMPFEFREGAYVIGTGVIKEIINAELKKQ
jgi:translation elongation factor EF-Tu-like GTPase